MIQSYQEDKYGLKCIQEPILEILKDIHAYCEKQNIKYSLCGGSVLGAVRHHGFIPWDDDADIMFDRENYDKFLSSFSMPGYEIERDIWVFRVKRIGGGNDSIQPCVDLFVNDNVPDAKCERKFKELLLKTLQGMIKPKVNYAEYGIVYGICSWITHIMGMPFTKEFKLKLYDAASRIGNSKKTEKVCVYNTLYKYLTVYQDGKVMDELQLFTFEDTKLYVVSKYDRYLTTLYGDYMTPPSVEDRVPQHSMSNLYKAPK